MLAKLDGEGKRGCLGAFEILIGVGWWCKEGHGGGGGREVMVVVMMVMVCSAMACLSIGGEDGRLRWRWCWW